MLLINDCLLLIKILNWSALDQFHRRRSGREDTSWTKTRSRREERRATEKPQRSTETRRKRNKETLLRSASLSRAVVNLITLVLIRTSLTTIHSWAAFVKHGSKEFVELQIPDSNLANFISVYLNSFLAIKINNHMIVKKIIRLKRSRLYCLVRQSMAVIITN